MATPPLPNFPEPALLTALVHQRYQAFDPDGPPTDHLTETNREVTGDQGWSATLKLMAPRRTTHALLPLTKPLIDWWQDVVTTAVRSCPPPHDASRNPPANTPTTWNKATTLRRFQAAGDVVFPDETWTSLLMTCTVAYDGMVHTPHFTWPFDPAPIGNVIANAIANALGNLRAHNMENQPPGFDLFLTHPEGAYMPREQVFIDFSDMAPPPKITSKPPDLPEWNSRTQRIPDGVCQGRSCAYPPAPTNNHPSGCDIAWKRYAQALAKAFTDPNPPIQFRTAPPQCILEVADPNHRCDQACRFGLRDHPLDHDELCRLPDGRLFILSHPYPQDTDDTFTANLDTWQEHVPDLAIRTAGASRSWYLPNRAVLVAVGERTTLDQLNLHYTIPHGDEPFGCIRWTGAREQDPSP